MNVLDIFQLSIALPFILTITKTFDKWNYTVYSSNNLAHIVVSHPKVESLDSKQSLSQLRQHHE